MRLAQLNKRSRLVRRHLGQWHPRVVQPLLPALRIAGNGWEEAAAKEAVEFH